MSTTKRPLPAATVKEIELARLELARTMRRVETVIDGLHDGREDDLASLFAARDFISVARRGLGPLVTSDSGVW